MSKCKLQKGDISILIEEKLQDSSGHAWPDGWTVNCEVEVGTILRIPYESQEDQKPSQPESTLSHPLPKEPSAKKKATQKKKSKISHQREEQAYMR